MANFHHRASKQRVVKSRRAVTPRARKNLDLETQRAAVNPPMPASPTLAMRNPPWKKPWPHWKKRWARAVHLLAHNPVAVKLDLRAPHHLALRVPHPQGLLAADPAINPEQRPGKPRAPMEPGAVALALALSPRQNRSLFSMHN